MNGTAKLTREIRQAEAQAPRLHTRTMVVCLALAALLIGWWYAWAEVTYKYFDLGSDSSIQSWTVPLPLGFEVVRWKSVPPGPQDGVRLFWPD